MTTETEAPEAPETFPMELTEFCLQLSRKDRRVSRIGAFHARMQRQGLKVATEAFWMDEYQKWGEKLTPRHH